MTPDKPDSELLDQGDSTVEDFQRTARRNLLGWERGILHEELRTPDRDAYAFLFEKHPEDAVMLMGDKLTEAKKLKREAKQHIQDLASAGSCWELGTPAAPDAIRINLGKHREIYTLTYRFVFMVYNGIFLETEEFVRHQCNNRACIRPSHLLSGSERQNREDDVSRVYSGRMSKGRGQGLKLELSEGLSRLNPRLKEYLSLRLETDVRTVGRPEGDPKGRALGEDELRHLLDDDE